MKPFFPEYLDENSRGPGVLQAVKLLQLMLLMGGFNVNIIPDGDFGKQTLQGVMRLQKKLGFSGSDVDGKFGPRTRTALYAQLNLDINDIPADAFEGMVSDDEPVTAVA